MKVQVQKWGNSLALRIPRSFAVETSIEDGTTVDISINKNGLLVRPEKKEVTLDELLAGVTKDNLHNEVDFGPGKGKEIW